MIFKLERKPPEVGKSIEEPASWFPTRVREFLVENTGKRVAVLFKPGKRGRLRKVTVGYYEGCSCCQGPTFTFTR